MLRKIAFWGAVLGAGVLVVALVYHGLWQGAVALLGGAGGLAAKRAMADHVRKADLDNAEHELEQANDEIDKGVQDERERYVDLFDYLDQRGDR